MKRALLVAVLALTAVACDPPPTVGTIDVTLTTDPALCDPLGGDRCYLPFPNNYFTIPSDDTATGLRVRFQRDALPANAAGVHIDPTELNRNDGFSPGSALAVHLPGVDLAASGAAPQTDIARSLDDDAPIVIMDMATGERHPYWAETDAGAPDDAHRLTFIRPARNLREGHRYVVALRDLVDGDGEPLPPSDVFRAYRDMLDTGIPALENRRWSMEGLFGTLEFYGVEREDLILAWDFTIASKRSLSERALHMRDEAFEELGNTAPDFQVTSVTESTRSDLLREVQGTFTVPNYLTGSGAAGAVLNNGNGPGDSPVPQRNGDHTARFICTIPDSAINPDGSANPTRMSLYGHGLMGSAREVLGAGSRFSRRSNTTYCATWWIGMSEEDIGSVVAALQDMSAFRTIPDRLQQSLLNFQFLGRLMRHKDGLSTHPAFQAADGTPLLDQENLTFIGVSQGGILGGAATALSTEWDRAFLGVPGMNYSTLLDRSIDFDAFAALYDPSYPDRIDRQMGILLSQMLWDRGENNAYAQHLTYDGYASSGNKQVMLFAAFGDHQVANISTDVMARTIGAKLRAPGLAPGRSLDVEPFWGIEPVTSMPDAGGSYYVMWDFGTPAPPVGNVPNRAGEDPHGMGRSQDEVLDMALAFLDTGTLIDTCGGGPCQTLP